MAVVRQELDPVLLGGYRVGAVQRNELNDFQVRDLKFVAARGALIRAHLARDAHGGFLRQAAHPLKDLRRDSALRHHTLNNPRPVAEKRKQ